jgi:hypothetical protein
MSCSAARRTNAVGRDLEAKNAADRATYESRRVNRRRDITLLLNNITLLLNNIKAGARKPTKGAGIHDTSPLSALDNKW